MSCMVIACLRIRQSVKCVSCLELLPGSVTSLIPPLLEPSKSRNSLWNGDSVSCALISLKKEHQKPMSCTRLERLLHKLTGFDNL